MKKSINILLFAFTIVALTGCASETTVEEEEIVDYSYALVDTNQGLCYDNLELITCPIEGEDFYGQDAQYTGNTPDYTDNSDGTVSDNVTDLMWTQSLSESSMSWEDTTAYVDAMNEAEYLGYSDWRLPSLKELWSIRDFSSGGPWVNTDYFYLVGDGSEGAQQHTWSSNAYLVDTDEAVDNIAFAVNDWTGHIKSFTGNRFVRLVRGNEDYGINDFEDNTDGTVSDNATGLMWAQDDNGEGIEWVDALAYVEEMNEAEYLGYSDWRLPNVIELQSIVDYSGVFPAIDTAYFNISSIVNEAGNDDYPYFWTSTTNAYLDPRDETVEGYSFAWYVAFGYSVGEDGEDLHGAGAVRFDTKNCDGADGIDGERYYNYVRLVRGGDVTETPEGDATTVNEDRVISFPDGDTGMPDNNQTQTGIDYDAAAETLNVTVDELYTALGITVVETLDPDHPDGDAAVTLEELDIATAAITLGVTEEVLLDALASGMEPIGNGPDELEQQVPDFVAAAAILGVTEEELQAALGDPALGEPDFAAAAAILGVTEDALIEALATGIEPIGSDLGEEQQVPDFVAAADILGVTEEALQAALGDPALGEPDYAAAAATLGVTEADLIAALEASTTSTPPAE